MLRRNGESVRADASRRDSLDSLDSLRTARSVRAVLPCVGLACEWPKHMQMDALAGERLQQRGRV